MRQEIQKLPSFFTVGWPRYSGDGVVEHDYDGSGKFNDI